MNRTLIAAAVAVLTCWQSAPALELIADGKAMVSVVIPDQANDTEKKSAKALVRYLKQATGVELPVVAEAQRPAGAVVSVGLTRAAKRAGVSTKGLENDGYRLRVIGDVLYVLGRDLPRDESLYRWLGAQGSLRAALALLEELGFRWLQPTDQGVYVPDVKVVRVPDDLNLSYSPPFMYVVGRMYKWNDWSMANNFRSAVRMYTRGGHTWVEFVPASLWETHPEYFRLQGGKRIKPTGNNYFLCPSNPGVIKLFADGLRKKFEEGYDLVQLGQSDGYEPCECKRCRALDQPGECGEQVHVPHYEAIKMVGESHPDKKVHLLIYGPTSRPSARFESYPPNVVVEVCGPSEERLKMWSERAPGGLTVYVYYMGTYHDVGLAPKCTPKLIAEEIRKLNELGVKGIYFCGGGENWGAEGPTYYVAGRMLGDPSRDWSRLLDEYCHLTFGSAGRTMRRYYDLLFARVESGARLLDGGREVFPATYPPPVLERLDNLLAMAKAEAEGEERALNWLRLVELSHRHLSLIARGYHTHNAYQCNRTMDNLKEVMVAVNAYHGLANEIPSLRKEDPSFVRSYFPNHHRWARVATNDDKLGAPFKWDFESLLKANMLPGKSRARTVLKKLAVAPALDGVFDEAAWEGTLWVDMPEVALGKVEAATSFRLGYDDRNVYVGFLCREPLIDEMVVKAYGRDGPVWRTECVELFFDIEGSGDKTMHFIAVPATGSRYDARRGYIDDPFHPLVLKNREDSSWDPEWAYGFKIDEAGKRWTMEVAIPFATLGTEMPAEGTRWRANFARERSKSRWDPKRYRRLPVELSLWSPNLQKASFLDTSVYGDLFFGRAPDGD